MVDDLTRLSQIVNMIWNRTGRADIQRLCEEAIGVLDRLRGIAHPPRVAGEDGDE